jgi:hypothetical protein
MVDITKYQVYTANCFVVIKECRSCCHVPKIFGDFVSTRMLYSRVHKERGLMSPAIRSV